jgi:hypothetical protein
MATNLNTLIRDRINENKKSIKTYSTYEKADMVGHEEGDLLSQHYGKKEIPVWFIVASVPMPDGTIRYTPVFQLMRFLSDANTGGYLGHFAQRGFFSI